MLALIFYLWYIVVVFVKQGHKKINSLRTLKEGFKHMKKEKIYKSPLIKEGTYNINVCDVDDNDNILYSVVVKGTHEDVCDYALNLTIKLMHNYKFNDIALNIGLHAAHYIKTIRIHVCDGDTLGIENAKQLEVIYMDEFSHLNNYHLIRYNIPNKYEFNIKYLSLIKVEYNAFK